MMHTPSLRAEFPAAYRSSAPRVSDDFWPVFRDLIEVRETYGLSRPVLSTLRALITFMEHGPVVFASNHKICERAEGISQSTLRRHIKALIDAGFAKRIDSPNRKRYALRTQGLDDLIFGIDLTPLLGFQEQIHSQCQAARETAAQIRHLRKTLGAMLFRAQDLGVNLEDLQPHRNALRRKLPPLAYHDAIEAVDKLLQNLIIATQMNANDSHIDCHKNITNKKYKNVKENQNHIKNYDEQTMNQKAHDIAPNALEMLASQNYETVDTKINTLSKWISVSPNLINQAKTAIGRYPTLLSLLIIIENIQRIKNPVAYFTALTIGQRQRQFIASIC